MIFDRKKDECYEFENKFYQYPKYFLYIKLFGKCDIKGVRSKS